MAVVKKLRDNPLIESRADLETNTLNNIASYFDQLGIEINYNFQFAYFVTLEDGSKLTAGTGQVKIRDPKTGQEKLRRFRNRFATLEIYTKPHPFSKKILARLFIGEVDISDYNPTPTDLDGEEIRIKKLIAAGALRALVEAVETEIEPLERGSYVILSLPDGKIQMGPFDNPGYAQGKEDQTLQIYKSYNRSVSGTVFTGDNPGLPIFVAIDNLGRTMTEPQPPGALDRLPYKEPPPQPPSAIEALRRWYDMRKEELPTVYERAKLFKRFGLGTINTYLGTAEQNSALLAELKKQ